VGTGQVARLKEAMEEASPKALHQLLRQEWRVFHYTPLDEDHLSYILRVTAFFGGCTDRCRISYSVELKGGCCSSLIKDRRSLSLSNAITLTEVVTLPDVLALTSRENCFHDEG
jgi:hypothetical protein